MATKNRWKTGLALVLLCLLGMAVRASSSADHGKDDPEARDRWFAQNRRAPAGQSPAELRLKALEQARSLPLAKFGLPGTLRAAGLTPGGAWQEIGPRPVLQVGTPLSGRVTCLAVDLNKDPSGNTVYLGAASGGVWKSTDAMSASPHFTPYGTKIHAAISLISQS